MPVDHTTSPNVYDPEKVCAFMRSRERYGALSNMTGGFPIIVNGLNFQSSEGLFQALKFPHAPRRQLHIAEARSGLDAKKRAYAAGAKPMPGWDDIRIAAMAQTLAEKLRQHPARFSDALSETGNRPIVEKSYRDPFWGAQPSAAGLVGRNVLGRLLQELRDAFYAQDNHSGSAAREFASRYPAEQLRVNGKPFPDTTDAARRLMAHRTL